MAPHQIFTFFPPFHLLLFTARCCVFLLRGEIELNSAGFCASAVTTIHHKHQQQTTNVFAHAVGVCAKDAVNCAETKKKSN